MRLMLVAVAQIGNVTNTSRRLYSYRVCDGTTQETNISITTSFGDANLYVNLNEGVQPASDGALWPDKWTYGHKSAK